jgi:hypothetical protein
MPGTLTPAASPRARADVKARDLDGAPNGLAFKTTPSGAGSSGGSGTDVKIAQDPTTFEITAYSASPPTSLFELPPGARVTTQ